MNTKTQPRTLTNCPGLLLLFCGSVPGLTTCLPLVWVKNCSKLVQIARSYDFANCVKSLVFANHQRTVKCWKFVQLFSMKNRTKKPAVSCAVFQQEGSGKCGAAENKAYCILSSSHMASISICQKASSAVISPLRTPKRKGERYSSSFGRYSEMKSSVIQ